VGWGKRSGVGVCWGGRGVGGRGKGRKKEREMGGGGGVNNK